MIIEDRFDSTTGKNIQKVTFDAPLFQPCEPEDDEFGPILDEDVEHFADGGHICQADARELARDLLECRRFLRKLHAHLGTVSEGGMLQVTLWQTGDAELHALIDNRQAAEAGR